MAKTKASAAKFGKDAAALAAAGQVRPGRKPGAKKYKEDLLMRIIGNLLPSGMDEWTAVADQYVLAAQESLERDPVHIKRHFTQKMCDGFKKPTGSSVKSKNIEKAQKIYSEIMEKNNAEVFGADDGDNGDDDDDDDDDEDETYDIDDEEDDEDSQDFMDDEIGGPFQITQANPTPTDPTPTPILPTVPTEPTLPTLPTVPKGKRKQNKTKNVKNVKRVTAGANIKTLTETLSNRSDPMTIFTMMMAES